MLTLILTFSVREKEPVKERCEDTLPFVILSGAKRGACPERSRMGRTSRVRERQRARQSKRSLDKLGMTRRNSLSLRERVRVRVTSMAVNLLRA
jgi:hypothetical protein